MTHRSLDAKPGTGPTVAAVVAGVAMLAIGIVFAVSGLLMPAWAVVGLLIVWVVLVWFGVRLAQSGSYLVLVIPVIAALVWFLAAWLGDAFLGWTA